MKPSKQTKVASMQAWLMSNDIRFIEHPNGLFLIFDPDGGRLLTWYTSTEKFKDEVAVKWDLGNNRAQTIIRASYAIK